MNPKDFTSDRAGRVIKTLNGYWAFVPAPLPPDIDYGKIALALSEADAAVSELSGLGRYLPNPDLLIGPYIHREAVASSRIEGTQADLAELLFSEIEPDQTPAGSDVGEVQNYVRAIHHGISRLPHLPLANRLVRELHAVLMSEVRGSDETPGEFRRSQNWIGSPGCTLAEATYVPPPHDLEMHECLKHWEVFVNQRGQMPELVQCALIHEHFEAIHPFLDGNGRIGRLLIPLFLMERERLSKPLLYVSTYIEQHREEYYALLQRIRTHGDWSAWLRYFLGAVRDSARSAIRQGNAILRLRDQYREQIGKQSRALMLLDHLFVNPYTTVAHAAKHLGVTAPTASKTIKRLESLEVIEEVTGRVWGRFWLAKPILNVVTSPPAEDDPAGD